MGIVEIKIGIQNVAREVSLESNQTADEVSALVNKALTERGLLELSDDKGRRVVVPAAHIGYVDLGPESVRRVGFGAF